MSAERDSWQDTFRDYIVQKGMRVTEQRITIAEAFFERGGHSNVEELYEVVRQRRPGTGYATVYRTIKLLEECGLAESRDFGDGTTRFEPTGEEHHDHLICNRCGHIIEFENEAIERLQLEVAQSLGFSLVNHKMELYGNCMVASRGDQCPNDRRPRAKSAGAQR